MDDPTMCPFVQVIPTGRAQIRPRGLTVGQGEFLEWILRRG